MVVKLIPAKKEHIPHIAANVRKEDADELYDYCLLDPEEALKQSLAYSMVACTGTVDSVPVCMFGVGPDLSEVGKIWLIGTSDLNKYASVFLRRNEMFFKMFLYHYSKVENYVEESNSRAIEWLKWLGFQFSNPEPIGPFNKPFIYFSLNRRQHAIYRHTSR